MQIRTTEVLAPVGAANIRKTTTEAGGDEGGKKPYALLTELDMEADTIDTRKEGPQKAKNRTTSTGYAIPGTSLQESKSACHRNIQVHVYFATVHSSPDVKSACVFITR